MSGYLDVIRGVVHRPHEGRDDLCWKTGVVLDPVHDEVPGTPNAVGGDVDPVSGKVGEDGPDQLVLLADRLGRLCEEDGQDRGPAVSDLPVLAGVVTQHDVGHHRVELLLRQPGDQRGQAARGTAPGLVLGGGDEAEEGGGDGPPDGGGHLVPGVGDAAPHGLDVGVPDSGLLAGLDTGVELVVERVGPRSVGKTRGQ